MENRVISVVIPVYNAAKWLEETLNSVLAQTIDHAQLEIIVVDDGSQDNSAEIAQTVLSNQDIRYHIIKTTNGGPSRARNIGWRQARGEWIQFLDADDLLAPEKIVFQFQQLPLDESIAVIYSEWQRIAFIHGHWQATGAVQIPILNATVVDLLKSNNFLQLGTSLFRRSWLEKVSGFNEESWPIEDVELLITVAIAGGNCHFVASGKPLLFYRYHADSLSNRHTRQFMRGCLYNTNLVNEWVQQQGIMSSESRTTLIKAYNFVARNTYRVDMETFEAAYRALCRLSPNGIYHPQAPKHLALLSRLIGYKYAEEIAFWYRHWKSLFISPGNKP
jgi:glycosyltransferase involved in cell wall biosynthesis